MISSRDIQEIISKLSSDKAKARDEGIKLLCTWLEGERLTNFCRYIGNQTSKLQPNDISHSETWPFLITLLIQSASLEISTSKRRLPKLIYAKTLRIVAQQAEDAKLSGKMLPLLSVVKSLFNHIYDVLNNVPSFQSEYGVVLRHLLPVKDYCFQMRKPVYCNLVRLYLEKVETSLNDDKINQHPSKEEVFRCILTLHSLLQNPPKDYPDNLRKDILKGFSGILSCIREEGKIARKLIECVNTYLSNDGPNLGCRSLEIHNAAQKFVFRIWLSTHDRVLKDAIILYARLQLNLVRGATDGSHLIEQLLDVVCKDLDQHSTSEMSRVDVTRDDKLGVLSSVECGLAELSALLFYKACLYMTRAPSTEKRIKRVHSAEFLREALVNGKWLWNASFCCLIRNYHHRISKDLLLYWFEGMWSSFERIMNDASAERSYDGFLWTLRSLHELSSALLPCNLDKPPPVILDKFTSGWQLIWNSLAHGLAVFSNITAVADAALLLLGRITANDVINTYAVAQDFWDLGLFKRKPSMSVLYFVSSYFSRGCSQGDLREVLHLRKNLLGVILSQTIWKEQSKLNEQMVLFLPAAIFALTTGCVPFSKCYKGLPLSYTNQNISHACDKMAKMEDQVQQNADEIFDCSVEVLAKFDGDLNPEVSFLQSHPRVRLPREISDKLLHDMETLVLGSLEDDKIGESSLSDLFYVCALLSNLLYGSSYTTKREDLPFQSSLGQYLILMLECAISSIQRSHDFRSISWISNDVTDGTSSLFSSLRSFISSPFINKLRGGEGVDNCQPYTIIQSLERLLKAFCKWYEECSNPELDVQPELTLRDLTGNDRVAESSGCNYSSRSRIIDMELDVDDDSRDVDILTASGNIANSDSFFGEKRKMEMIATISCFFSVLHGATWNILFKLAQKESDSKVQGKIIFHLCQNPYWSASAKLTELVNSIHSVVKMQVTLKRNSVESLAAIRQLIASLVSMDVCKDKFCGLSTEKEFEQSLLSLGDVVNEIAEVDILDWSGRLKLVDCICDFILLFPQVGQTMIERLLLMLQDPDYRVRFFLGRRIDVLFKTWDGHEELFCDICSNFGVPLVVCSKGKLVTAKEVLSGGSYPQTTMETIITTLMHLAFHSEKIELEAVFMMSVVAAIDPCHRELVCAALDNLSRHLQYASRMKYLGELMGSLLFCWVACGVSLVALTEIRQYFVADAEPSYFIQYCCHWLLPALFVYEDSSHLTWVSKVACQSLTDLVKNYFVSIFSVCMALHCSQNPRSDRGTFALQNLVQKFAGLTEVERDNLIKRHMVSIVSCILSLSSCLQDPAVPFFSKDTVYRAIQTIVDGFLEMEDCHTSVGVVDRINIFRHDRIFMFLMGIHHKISEAAHHRHKCNHLAGVKVLIDVLGDRATSSSTFNYVFNLIGQFIDTDALQEQCFEIISELLRIYKVNPSQDVTDLLGEQLQFLVSKLVACCDPSEAKGHCSGSKSSKALSLLLELTVNSDSSLHDYIRELEPFPELELFNEIRKFHEKISGGYSLRDHLLKFAKRSCYLPSKLLLQSLKALYNKLMIDKGSRREVNVDGLFEGKYWHDDREIMGAVWLLVRICGSKDTSSVRELVSDFVSRVGVGDPHCVVFHLLGDANHINFIQGVDTDHRIEIFSDTRISLPEKTLISLLRILKKYLLDDSVYNIEVTSQALRGVLSTERGQRALRSFGPYEKSLIEIHSKGVDIELVTKCLLDLDKKFEAEAILLDKSEVWMTRDKTFETWICPLVHSLIGYCSDVVLRLCQDIVLLKAEVAELLLPCVVVDLARRKDLDVNLHELISFQVQKHVFVESNKLIKSIQVWLNCLNELRICHVMEKSCFVSLKRESSKSTRPSSQSSKSRAASLKSRGTSASSSAWETCTSSWEKVYWLSIDYLHVAKSAVVSGSYFTSLMYVEYWCEEHFKGLTLGSPDFSHIEMLSPHIQILVSAVTKINEPDSLYGILQSYKLTTQIITFEHEGNWGKALEYYDLQVRSDVCRYEESRCRTSSLAPSQVSNHKSLPSREDEMRQRKSYKGLIRSLQQIGCMHLLDFYCQGLTSMKGQMQQDLEFTELQYEAAWRAGNWEFTLPYAGTISSSSPKVECDSFNQNLHGCLRALHEGDSVDFHKILKDSKQELICSISHASEESTESIHSTIIKLQIFYHLGVAWDIRWGKFHNGLSQPTNPSMDELSWLNEDWCSILERIQLHMNLLEPFVAFRRVLLQVLGCRDSILQHLLQSASTLRKGSRFSQAAAALHEYNLLSVESKGENSPSYWLGRLEEAKLLRAQGQHEMAISLAKYISEDFRSTEEGSDVFRLVGKWLAETRSSNSRTILEKYLKPAVSLAEDRKPKDKKAMERRSQTHFQLAHYADALFRSHEERLSSNEWQSAMRLRKHKTMELEALVKRLKSSIKGDKSDYSAKIQELQRQLAMDKEEAQKLQDDRDNFLLLALEGYKQCLVIGQKYDVRVVFRLVSLWFTLSSREDVVNSMLDTIEKVQSYKFVPLVYQIASRMGSTKDGRGPNSFQFALVSLVKKMAIEHPYHTVFQLLALANGDRIKDKQRSRSSFVVDVDKKLAAENLLKELSSYHGDIMCQMKRMVEIYIKLAELETRREDTCKKVILPRELRNLPPLELVPVVTAPIPVDHSCQYLEGSFPYFKGLTDSITVMNGINAPKVVECLGSDGHKYRQLAKSGNDDLRQDAVMEQFFALVNTFLRNRQDTWKRRLGVRTYKVVPFTPSAGVVEWVDNTLPLGEYLIGSMRNGGAHGRYGHGDWSFLKCREHMANERDKRKAFKEVSKNFRPVMHYFFLERFLQPADWFEKRLAYTRSVAASSMVGYIVGLGDRHSMNILIDETTAEVVHIDLGVAFEQGLMLKTPERVPFRLTRDIIDGMGVAGVEGVFRRCCEETLSVMRTNKEALLTIIEVFIHDPLYKWALSPLKALQRQKETDDDLETSLEDSQDEYEGNKDAARALLRVKQKLDGYEGGEMRSLNGQVQQLIQDAIDPERLCHMFPGWGAWL